MQAAATPLPNEPERIEQSERACDGRGDMSEPATTQCMVSPRTASTVSKAIPCPGGVAQRLAPCQPCCPPHRRTRKMPPFCCDAPAVLVCGRWRKTPSTRLVCQCQVCLVRILNVPSFRNHAGSQISSLACPSVPPSLPWSGNKTPSNKRPIIQRGL